MFDADKDTPIQVKHPEWVQWFKDNHLDIYRLAVSPAPEYLPETGELVVTLFHRNKPIGDDGEYTTYAQRVKVDPIPPWFDEADLPKVKQFIEEESEPTDEFAKETSKAEKDTIKDEKPAEVGAPEKPKPRPRAKKS